MICHIEIRIKTASYVIDHILSYGPEKKRIF